MTAGPLAFDEFRKQVDELRASLEASKPQAGSLEAYLLNHVRTLSDNASRSSSFKEITKSVDALSRFCVESMDSDQLLFQRCQALLAAARKQTR
jgi:hypothetical protein